MRLLHEEMRRDAENARREQEQLAAEMRRTLDELLRPEKRRQRGPG
jgi:hypothetical protein